jgi:cation transport ATPase
MNLNEIFKNIFNSFFVIFTGAVLSMYAFLLIFGVNELSVHYITAVLVMTVLGSLAYFIFYSKSELTRKQMAIRHAIHLAAILAIMLGVASTTMRISLREPAQLFVFIASVIAVYAVVMLTNIYRNKKLADKMNEKLREKYKD